MRRRGACDWSVAVGVSAFRAELSAEAASSKTRGEADLEQAAESLSPGGGGIHAVDTGGDAMPHIMISTQIRLETGPTNVGDEFSDPDVMNYLGARKTIVLGNNFAEYHVDDPPRLVLDKLEKIGFRVLTMTGVGQTLVWCLHREAVSI